MVASRRRTDVRNSRNYALCVLKPAGSDAVAPYASDTSHSTASANTARPFLAVGALLRGGAGPAAIALFSPKTLRRMSGLAAKDAFVLPLPTSESRRALDRVFAAGESGRTNLGGGAFSSVIVAWAFRGVARVRLAGDGISALRVGAGIVVDAADSSTSTNTSICLFVTVVADLVVVDRRAEVDELLASPIVVGADALFVAMVAFASPRTVTALPFPLMAEDE